MGASIRPPRPEDTDSSAKRGPDFRPLYDVPFMFEAREFLRKKLIGHQVQVTVDYVQAARTEPGQGSFPEKFCCTIMISGVNVAEALVSKGLATVVRYAQGNDDRSSKYDELLQAEEKAKKTGKGLHDKKNTPCQGDDSPEGGRDRGGESGQGWQLHRLPLLREPEPLCPPGSRRLCKHALHC